MKVGDKIRKIRELKSITLKDMADRLHISQSNYSRLECDEVSLTIDRLEVIAEIFGMKPEDVLTFDEKMVFHIINSPYSNGYQSNSGETHYQVADKISQLYEDKIKLLEEKIKWLEAGR